MPSALAPGRQSMRCQHLKPSGEACGAPAMAGAGYCYQHNPAVPEEDKQAARVQGGQTHRPSLPAPLPAIPIEAPRDVVTLLADTINRVRAGELDPRIANCLGVLAGHLLKAFELAQTAGRIEKIERIILERGIRRG